VNVMTPDTRRPLLELSKHPLTVLLLTTAIGSFVVPHINRGIARETKQQDLRVEQIRRAINTSAQVDRNLNAVTTSFFNFLRDEGQLTGGAASAARAALRSRVYQQYGEFERDAWWWHWQFLGDVSVLKITSREGEQRISEACSSYQERLLQSTAELDRLWRPLLRGPFNADPIPVDEIRSRLKQLQADRQSAVRSMIAPLIH
jgi:hypothetical protein